VVQSNCGKYLEWGSYLSAIEIHDLDTGQGSKNSGASDSCTENLLQPITGKMKAGVRSSIHEWEIARFADTAVTGLVHARLRIE